jgi:hypothetical protein
MGTMEGKDGFILNYMSLVDLIFIVLPMIVLVVIKAVQSNDWPVEVFQSTDFGVASCIVYGQALVKYSGLALQVKGIDKKRSMFLVSVLIALFFISMIVMMLVALRSVSSIFIYVSQIFLFLLSIYVHFYIGYFEEEVERLEVARLRSVND